MEDRVYFAIGVDGEACGYMKVGMSKHPRKRMAELRREPRWPDGRFELVGHIPGSYAEEWQIHRVFSEVGACVRDYGREIFFADRVVGAVERILAESGDDRTYQSSLLERSHPGVVEAAHYKERRLVIEATLAVTRVRAWARSGVKRETR